MYYAKCEWKEEIPQQKYHSSFIHDVCLIQKLISTMVVTKETTQRGREKWGHWYFWWCGSRIKV